MKIVSMVRENMHRQKNPQGLVVGIIEVVPKNHKRGKFNPLRINWVVNPLRKDAALYLGTPDLRD